MRIKSCNITRGGGEHLSAVSECLKAAIELAASSSLIFTVRWIAENRDIVKVREVAGNEIVDSKHERKRMEKNFLIPILKLTIFFLIPTVAS